MEDVGVKWTPYPSFCLRVQFPYFVFSFQLFLRSLSAFISPSGPSRSVVPEHFSSLRLQRSFSKIFISKLNIRSIPIELILGLDKMGKRSYEITQTFLFGLQELAQGIGNTENERVREKRKRGGGALQCWKRPIFSGRGRRGMMAEGMEKRSRPPPIRAPLRGRTEKRGESIKPIRIGNGGLTKKEREMQKQRIEKFERHF